MRLYHESATSCSVGGVVYEADETGAIEVPDELAAELLPHGFTTAKPGEPIPVEEPFNEEETGEDVITKLARATKAEIVAFAQQVHNLELDIAQKKDSLLEAIMGAMKKLEPAPEAPAAPAPEPGPEV